MTQYETHITTIIFVWNHDSFLGFWSDYYSD